MFKKLLSSRKKISRRKRFKIKLLLIVGVAVFILICALFFFMDDDLYLHYLMQQTSPIENVQENLNTPVYDITEVKSKNKRKQASADGTYDVTSDEVIAILNEILGNFGLDWIKGDTSMPNNAAEHIQKALPMLISMNLKYKILVSTGIMQSGIETGWGSATPPSSNNYFGIKGGGVATTPYWDGRTVATASGEGEGGSYTVQVSSFRVYDSLYDSIMDYGYFFHANDIYTTGGIQQLGYSGDQANVFNATDGIDQLKRIMNAGYATSPNSYISSGQSIYDSMDLKRFDDVAIKVAESLASSSGDAELGDGEWAPAGDTDWADEAGIDISGLSSKRIAVLNEAFALRGCYYQLVRPWKLPTKNADGTYNITDDYVMEPNNSNLPYYLDCSAFTHEAYNQALNVQIGNNTWEQMDSTIMETISVDEAKPGDIWLPHSGHVVIFLRYDANEGKVYYIHSPQTFLNGSSPPRGRVILGSRSITSGGMFRRLKGIDG